MIPPHITYALRFNDDDTVLCEGMSPLSPCRSEGSDEPAIAIHIFHGHPRCAQCSPAENIYVPCTACGERPAYKPETVEEDPLCQLCLRALIEKAAEAAFIVSQRKPETADEQDEQDAELAKLDAEYERVQHPSSVPEYETVGQVCRRMSGAPEFDPSHTPGGYAPDGLGAPDDEIVQGPQFQRTPRPKRKRG